MSLVAAKSKEERARVAARAVEILAEDGIVAFPTETVFGLAIRADSALARERLYALKGRDAQKPMASYVADPARADLGSRAVERLARALWPGPLTIVIANEDGTTRGYRCSSHPFAAALAAASTLPFLGTSANLSGEESLNDAAAVQERFGDALGLTVIDEEPSSGRASTVVQIEADGDWKIVREGEIDARVIARELKQRILFVCTGNTCRSPLAAAAWRALQGQRGVSDERRAETYSAGLATMPGSPASAGSTLAASAKNWDLGSHRSRFVSDELVGSADVIYAMTRDHLEALRAGFPEQTDRIFLLDPDGTDLVDPYGGDDQEYSACAKAIEACILRRLESKRATR